MSHVTGKQRAKRIDPAYPVGTDRLRRRRLLWSLAAMCCSLSYVVWCLAGAGQTEQQFSHGPVAQAHAMIERQCDACHEPFAPVRADAWAVRWGWGASETKSWGRAVEAKCQACHPTPDHHPQAELAADHVSCTVCHREHHGREAVITRAGDHVCLQCHDQLQDHRAVAADGMTPEPAAHIGRFDRDHPEFRSLASDPGKLKSFSHELHLSAGVRPAGVDEQKLSSVRWQDLETPAPERPASAALSDRVQLECRHCHELSRGDATGPNSATQGDENLLPIRFDQHCRGCHQRDLPVDIPHGAKRAEISHQLERRFWRRQQRPTEDEVLIPVRPVPGQEATPELVAVREALSATLRDGQREVTERCGHCHQLAAVDDESPAAVLTPVIPRAWLQHARFRHAAHQGTSCAVCHADVGRSKHATDVLIAGRAVCANCHASQPQDRQLGSARFDCAECHQYHVDFRRRPTNKPGFFHEALRPEGAPP